ncbi:MAG: hypothetical protein AAGJ31_13865, partial [Verrucomicrobiota bacterium]
WVTSLAYSAGQAVENVRTSFRDDLGPGIPTQGDLVKTAHGHHDLLISHRAYLEDGELVIEAIPDAYNDTPFWIIQTSSDICAHHGDIYNDRFLELTERITKLNRLYETGVTTWLRPMN